MSYISFNDEGPYVKVQYFRATGRRTIPVRTSMVPKNDVDALVNEIEATLAALRTDRSPVGKVDR